MNCTPWLAIFDHEQQQRAVWLSQCDVLRPLEHELKAAAGRSRPSGARRGVRADPLQQALDHRRLNSRGAALLEQRRAIGRRPASAAIQAICVRPGRPADDAGVRRLIVLAAHGGDRPVGIRQVGPGLAHSNAAPSGSVRFAAVSTSGSMSRLVRRWQCRRSLVQQSAFGGRHQLTPSASPPRPWSPLSITAMVGQLRRRGQAVRAIAISRAAPWSRLLLERC